jgi:hypothetical protein
MPSDVFKSGTIARDTRAELKHGKTLGGALAVEVGSLA